MERHDDIINLTPEESRLSGLPLEFPASDSSLYLSLVNAVVARKSGVLSHRFIDQRDKVNALHCLAVLRPLAYDLTEVVAENEVIAAAERFLREENGES